jgi:putative transposase
LVTDARDWLWSSARAHLAGKDDLLVKVAPLLKMIVDWEAFLRSAMPEGELRDIRRHSRTGRPLGDETFLDRRGNGRACAQAPEARSKTETEGELSYGIWN